MNLLKKFLIAVLSFGIMFTPAFLIYTFAATPSDLEECCLELDSILSS